MSSLLIETTSAELRYRDYSDRVVRDKHCIHSATMALSKVEHNSLICNIINI